MKNVFFNTKKAREEAEAKMKLALEKKEEEIYLESLKKDPRFQKYILEKRLKAPINELSDIMSTPTLSAEQLEKEIAARKSTVRVLQNIFHSIID